jgi:membrane-bound lytic murein transglycosylase MltF
MVNAGLAKITVVDSNIARFWVQVFKNISVREDVALDRGGHLGVAMRKNSPKLMAATNAFIKRNGPRTTFGNMVKRRYLVNAQYVKSATTEAEMKRFDSMVATFRKYGEQYDLDWLLMMAQGFQESGLSQDRKSPVGAVGVMQVMPETGKDLKVGDIHTLEPNIHAGVKYVRFMIDEYFKDEPMTPLNKALFAFASYNAGPARIRQLRQVAARRGLDPDVWFNNVERIVSERIGRETVQYVSNIYKYYVAYTLALEEVEQRRKARQGGVL